MKKKTYAQLKKKLDEVFSIYIRRKDAKEGWVNCFTCGKKFEWKYTDNGHFINRKHLATRWLEENCHPQCIGCNRFRDGNKEDYAVHLEAVYGHGILQKLQDIKNKGLEVKYNDLEKMIEYYKKLASELDISQ